MTAITAVTLIASAVQGLSQVGAGVAGNQQAKNNAELLKRLGLVAAADEEKITEEVQAALRTRAAAAGGDPNAGSNLDIALDTEVEGAIAARRAQFGFDVQARAEIQRGRALLARGIVSGVGSFLGGLTELAGQNPVKTSTTAAAPTPTQRSRALRVPSHTLF